MKIINVVKASVIVGALVSIPAYLLVQRSIDDERKERVIDVLSENNELTERIGTIEDVSVRKYTNYYGSPGSPAYLRYLLKVSGGKSKAMVSVKINNPDTSLEVVTLIKIEE